MQDIAIPQDIIREIADGEADFCRRIRKCDSYAGAENLSCSYKNTFNRLGKLYGEENLQRSKILEIGSGNGFFLCYALKAGLDIVGIEPGKAYGFQDRYSRAIKLMKLNEIQNPENFLFDSTAEALPFKDNTFDMVFSVAVLEHVQNLDLTMRESVRVLKPGGILWANIPNYNSIYEGHYDIFWFPYMKKNMAKAYVRKFFGRESYFIDELNFTNPSMFKKYLNSDDTRGELYLHGRGAFTRIFGSYNYCLNRSLLLPRLLLWPLVKLLQFFGMATTFDIILHKRNK